jgi:hypothetical protein
MTNNWADPARSSSLGAQEEQRATRVAAVRQLGPWCAGPPIYRAKLDGSVAHVRFCPIYRTNRHRSSPYAKQCLIDRHTLRSQSDSAARFMPSASRVMYRLVRPL